MSEEIKKENIKLTLDISAIGEWVFGISLILLGIFLVSSTFAFWEMRGKIDYEAKFYKDRLLECQLDFDRKTIIKDLRKIQP